jgi:hypothetical protein
MKNRISPGKTPKAKTQTVLYTYCTRSAKWYVSELVTTQGRDLHQSVKGGYQENLT